MISDGLFYTALALLFTHELDAVRGREWRLLFGLRRLDDQRGFELFTLLHVPLFALFLWLAAHPSPALRLGFQVSIDLFLIVHAGLHKRLDQHALYEFNNPLSATLIYGAGAVGLAHLMLLVLKTFA